MFFKSLCGSFANHGFNQVMCLLGPLKWKGLLLRGISIPNHRAPNHQFSTYPPQVKHGTLKRWLPKPESPIPGCHFQVNHVKLWDHLADSTGTCWRMVAMGCALWLLRVLCEHTCGCGGSRKLWQRQVRATCLGGCFFFGGDTPGRLTAGTWEFSGPLESGKTHLNQTIIFGFYVNLRGCICFLLGG